MLLTNADRLSTANFSAGTGKEVETVKVLSNVNFQVSLTSSETRIERKWLSLQLQPRFVLTGETYPVQNSVSDVFV